MKLKSQADLFVAQLRDIYSAEKQLVSALKKMAKAATDAELKAGFEEHLEQTRGQVARLDQVFADLKVKSRGKKCTAMEGLVEEGREAIDDTDAGEVRDAALIGAANRVEHYEMASYRFALALARATGHDDAAPLLEENLREEEQTEQKLAAMAEALADRASVGS